AEGGGETLRQEGDCIIAVALARFHDLRQRGPAERVDTEQYGAERRPRLAGKLLLFRREEHEAARHRPFTRARRRLEHERVRRIEANGAQELHNRGPRVSGSNHATSASFSTSTRRSPFPICRISTSPFSSMPWRTPGEVGSHCR